MRKTPQPFAPKQPRSRESVILEAWYNESIARLESYTTVEQVTNEWERFKGIFGLEGSEWWKAVKAAGESVRG